LSLVKKWRDVIDGVEVEVLEFSDTVESVKKASELSGEPPNHIVKTLLLKAGNDYIVAIVRGDRKVNLKKISQILRKPVTLSKPSEVEEVLKMKPGAVTPISGIVKSLAVLLDPSILENDYILCGGGALNRLFKVKTRDLVDYLKPQLIDSIFE